MIPALEKLADADTLLSRPGTACMVRCSPDASPDPPRLTLPCVVTESELPAPVKLTVPPDTSTESPDVVPAPWV